MRREADTACATVSGAGDVVMRPPAYVRFSRLCHALLASAFLACVVQVFFAGVGILGANRFFHRYSRTKKG
jgi:hypothetical protein